MMTQLENVLRVLAAVRKANDLADAAQQLKPTDKLIADKLSHLRVELSVAAGHLSTLVDEETRSTTTVRCACCNAEIPIESSVSTPTGAVICPDCDAVSAQIFGRGDQVSPQGGAE